ncbi:MAG TPA: 16S rRNA (adenine(1518)-N(6)/adenine(1519)-N(6))-dimethyltransferase RsmA [Candidatus Saccharimonadales bacterium]|nr:16S rRNA (adenine(1518)-N(6)/adenine(1519)-N(6))-dimethyltransferase RsmA [Candidatus Saccharimonadales bacterium]
MEDLLSKTREICRLVGINPKRSKGQNFLINERIYNDVIKAADLKKTDEILEVGPGLGFLTVKLKKEVKRVVAVELDDELANYLKIGFSASNEDKVKVVNLDILKFNLREEFPKNYKIVANLPYNITSIFLRMVLSGNCRPELLVLMLQKEVAERIVATAPDMSLLALSVQYYADASVIKNVTAGNFWPEPKVESAIIKIVVHPEQHDAVIDKLFFRMAKAGFSAKRKMLKNNLAGGLKIEPEIIINTLDKIGLDKQVRAENLNLADWHKLFAELSAFMV